MRLVLRTHTTILLVVLRSLLSLDILVPDTSSVELSLCNFQLSLELLHGERFVRRVDRLDGVYVRSAGTRRGGEGGGVVRVERAATGRVERFVVVVVVRKNGPRRFAARKKGVLRGRGTAFDGVALLLGAWDTLEAAGLSAPETARLLCVMLAFEFVWSIMLRIFPREDDLVK
jgi:hypothetical protein